MLAETFEHLAIFQGFTPPQREQLLGLFHLQETSSGTRLFTQGEPAEYLFVLVEGEILVHYTPDDGPAILVTRVHPGGVVGWSAALGSKNYTSEAECATSCRMLRVRSDDLRCLYERQPQIGAQLLERLAAVVLVRLPSSRQQVVTLLIHGIQGGINECEEELQDE